MAELRFEGVSRVFGEHVAVSQVDLVVPSGSLTVLIGPSGCGKTTLLHIAAGLEQATQGQVFLAGHPVLGPGPETAIIFQQHNLFDWLTIRENVAVGLQAQGVRKKERLAQADRLLADFGLSAFAHCVPRQLSGGMCQRVALARALVLNPQVLLMDEPFAALDYQTRHVMQRYLLALWQRTRATIVMVTHDIDEALTLADQIVLFSSSPGRIIEVIPVTTPYPRSLEQVQIRHLRQHLCTHLEREVGDLSAEERTLLETTTPVRV
jgi:NitT/TauT family transport system ATP-binding protein